MNNHEIESARSRVDLLAYTLLPAIYILVRIPFINNFSLVSYDGTYYINIAKSFLAGAPRASVFPIGYPVFIAALIPLFTDGVWAARIVSLLAGLGSVLVFYRLCRRYVDGLLSLIAGCIYTVAPLFIRLSMATMSESLYVFWVLAGFLFFAKKRAFPAGLSIGTAAITRPEALGIACVLGLLRLRAPRRLLLIAAGFIIPYAANVAVQSVAADRFVLLSKVRLFGTSAEDWKVRERMLTFEGQDRLLEQAGAGRNEPGVAADYVHRFPRDLLVLCMHATPMVVLLALFGVLKKRTAILAMFVPLLFFPFFALRHSARFLYAYIPACLLYAVIGLSHVRRRSLSIALIGLLIASAAAGVVINRDEIVKPVSDGFQWAEEIGRSFEDRVAPGDTIADRKPFFAFYAGGEYLEIPLAPIDQTLSYLATRAEFLVLHVETIRMLRPQLLPMIYDPIFIQSELRYRQTYAREDVIICRRVLEADPLSRTPIVPPSGDLIYGPCWSPDGRMIAFRTISTSAEDGIHVVATGGGVPERIVTVNGIEDPISWSPDSRRIAYAEGERGSMNIDIYVCGLGGTRERITSDGALDTSPTWSGDGTEILFTSNRTGRSEVWSKDLETGELAQVTNGFGGSFPAVSPDGARIAWIREGEGLVIFHRDSGELLPAAEPRRIGHAPSWSRDGRFIAVTGGDWGKMDVYLVTADGRNTVLVTKTTRQEGQPTWSADDAAIATVTVQEGGTALWILRGLDAYKARLAEIAGRKE